MRRLGATELCLWHGDKSSRINFVTVVRVRGPLDASAIRAGLDAVQARHPLFRARVVTRWRRPHFVLDEPAPPIPLDVLEGPVDDWVGHAEQRVRAWLDPAVAPLVRCAWLRHDDDHSTLLLTFHHIIGDGISGAYVVRDLLEALGDGIRAPLSEMGSIEAHTPPAVYERGFWRQHFGQIGRMLSWLRRHGKPVAPPLDAPRARPAARQVCIAPRALPPRITAALVERARAEKTTVHGILGAATLLAVAEDHGRPVPMLLASPVNLRARLVPPVGDDVGLFVSMAATMHAVEPDAATFWALAREVRDGLVRFVDEDGPFTLLPGQSRMLAVLARLTPAGLFARVARAIQLPGVGLTNIGRVAIDSRYGELTVEHLSFAASLGIMGEFAVTAATLDGHLTITALSMDPTVSRARGERLADRIIEWVEQAASAGAAQGHP